MDTQGQMLSIKELADMLNISQKLYEDTLIRQN